MLRLKTYAWLTLLTLAFSCERELEYDVQSPEAVLVVNCVFAQDSLWQVEVSTTADPGNGGQIKILKDAQVAIFENNVRISDIVLDSMDAQSSFGGEDLGRSGPVKLYYHRTVNSRARAGQNYEIRVSHPDYPTVYSTSVIPRSPRVRKSAQTGTVALQMIQGVPHARIPFTLSDEGGSNYYGLEVWSRNQSTGAPLEKLSFYSADNALLENTLVMESSSVGQHLYEASNTVFFSNRDFQGADKAFTLYINFMTYSNSKDLYVRVFRLSPELYEFAVSYQNQLVNQGNPFAEPAQVFSNIQNGSGIFAGYSVKQLDPR